MKNTLKHNTPFFFAAVLSVLILSSCSLPLGSPSLTPSHTAPAVSPTVQPTNTAPAPTPQPTATVQPSPDISPTSQPTEPPQLYAVILVEQGDVLNIRSAAGIDNAVIGSFPHDAANIRHVGASATAADQLWMEVENPSGGTGWVNAHYLTEHISPTSFCSDDRISYLLANFKQAVVNADGDLLAALVSPTHGLELYYRRFGPSANYTPEEASWVFESTYQVNWGADASGIDDIGTFSEIPLPKLLNVLTDPDYEQHCNDLTTASTYLEPWPGIYKNINYYALHKPASPDIELDWRTWLVGVEYVKGEPYLFTLIHFEWVP